jgi:hypothetical protein
MSFDLQSAQIAVSIVVCLLAILGVILGWFAKAWRWASSKVGPKRSAGVIDVPSKTMVLIIDSNAI